MREKFIGFIIARDQARVYKELGFSDLVTDPILKAYRFCNINREHDTVTKWVKQHLRDPFAKYGLQWMVTNLTTARIFNEPATLEHIIPIVKISEARAALKSLRESGKKVLRGAYMMPAHGENGKGRPIDEYWMDAIEAISKLPWETTDYLSGVAEQLQSVVGMGDFLSNQVCADLRYVPGYKWKDWGDFIRCGPGTRRGLDRYHGREATGNEQNQALYQEELRQVRSDLTPFLPKQFYEWFKDPNNLANSFCEFDKMCRAQEQVAAGKPITLRKYGNHKS